MGKMNSGKADVALVKKSHRANVAHGERAVQSDFKMTIKAAGMPALSALVRTSQMPGMSRGDGIEDFGPNNTRFIQQGSPEFSGDIAATIVELKTGRVRKALREIVKNKLYVEIEVKPSGEGYTDEPVELRDCYLRFDPADLDTSAETALNIPLQITYNDSSLWDDDKGGN